MESKELLMKPKDGAEYPKNALKNQNSNDSLISVIFPWRGKRADGRRRPLVSRNETGRTITTAGFYMCMMSIMLLCTGIGLSAASGWTLIYRVPYIYLSDGSFFLGTDSFTLLAGVLSFPCCWIAWVCHDNKKYYSILPLLMVLLSFSICMLTAGVGVGLSNKSKMIFNRTVNPPTVIPSHYRTVLNETMTYAMKNYDTNAYQRWSWDTTHRRLRCCGVNDPHEWHIFRCKMPCSCYLDEARERPKMVFARGCLDSVAFELNWEICFLTGVSFIAFFVKALTMLLLMVLLSACVCILSTGVGVGFLNKSRMVFDRTITPPKLFPCRFRSVLNQTMTSSMAAFGSSITYNWSWNTVQQRLRCCGVDAPSDWLKFRSLLPRSCFLNEAQSDPKILFLQGCLDVMAYELTWEICLLTGMSFLAFCVQITALLLAVFMYVNDKAVRVGTIVG